MNTEIRVSRLEDAVTFRHVVYALPVLAIALATSGGWVLALANAHTAPAYEQIAELKADIRARDAGMREQLTAMEARTTKQLTVVEAKVDRLVDRLLDGGAVRPAALRQR